MRSLPGVICAAVLVAACGRLPGTTNVTGDYKLYEATGDHSQIAVIDSQSRTVERRLPLGAPSSDWKHLYSIAGSTLTDTDPQTGATRFSLHLQGLYKLPPATLGGLPGGLSQDGRWIVAESFDRNANGDTSASHFLVLKTSLDAAPVRVDMPGSFEFDAISNDGERLYLIEYLSIGSYRVRIYHVSLQQLDPQVVIDKTDPKDSMSGLRLSGIPAPDGSYLYSLYVRQNDGPFIHALTLDGSPIAFCIDLPGAGYEGTADGLRWSIAISPDGSHLYAANAASGVVSEVDLGSSMAVARSRQVDSGQSVAGALVQDVQAKEMGTGAAVVSSDGKTLVAAAVTGIDFVDTGSLRTTARTLAGWTIGSVMLSPDGQALYTLSDSGWVAEIAMGTRHVDAMFASGDASPIALMRVAAA